MHGGLAGPLRLSGNALGDAGARAIAHASPSLTVLDLSAVRVLIAACLIASTLLGPLGLRELILAIAPSKALGLILAIVIGMGGLVAIPVELWMLSVVTDGLEPGSCERYESSDGDDWDWDD